MESKARFKSIVVEVICYLYILLFVYAAVSKLLDFENFQVQLGQSPLLSAFAVWVAWLVPGIELIIAVALMLPKFRTIGLLAALSLMTMFTAYIFIILNYSSFVPCSCGGILEKMTWNMHLVFNVVFVLLSVIAIILNRQKAKTTNRGYAITRQIAGTTLISISVVVVLFLSSENIMHHNNPFLRRYPTHAAEFSGSVDLKFNSYYFAGLNTGRIYLGNYTNPSHVVAMNTDLKDRQPIEVSFDPKGISFRAATLSVRNSKFFLQDGSVPALFSGDLKNWTVTKELRGLPYFTRAIPIDSTHVVFRSNNAVNSANVLGIYNADTLPEISYKRNLLEKQIDGIFDTDGTLLYSEELQKIIVLS